MSADVLRPEAVASMLGCAVTTVRERARAGDLPGLKFGDDWVFPAAALQQRLTELALELSALRRKPAARAVVLHTIIKKAPPVLPR